MHFLFTEDATHDQTFNFILSLKCVEKFRLALYFSTSVCCIEKQCDTNQDKNCSFDCSSKAPKHIALSVFFFNYNKKTY